MTEAVLESALMDRWGEIEPLGDLSCPRNQVDRMDIIAWHEPTGSLAVLELKRGTVGSEAIEQVVGYASGPAHRLSEGRPIVCAVVAREFIATA
ncbi:MAG: hypothetical protein VX681_07795 [Myxococcota bacterium]|nr:hypothetical protein [Myxococcota bacterium]